VRNQEANKKKKKVLQCIIKDDKDEGKQIS
jgi:hypothetical protein